MSSQASADESSDCNGSFHEESNENGSDAEDAFLPSSALELEQIQKAFTKMVCVQEVPPMMIECPIFKRFVSSLNPFVELGDFESLKNDCLKYYETEMMKIKHILRNMDAKVNLSVEMLKNDAFDDILCLTAHFVDDTWKWKKWVLRFQVLNWESYSGAIVKSLEYWGIMDKVFTITVKSDIFDAETLEWIQDYIQKKTEAQVKGKLLHVHCCAWFLSSMAQDAFQEISMIIDKVRDLIIWGKLEPVWSITNSKLKEALDLQSRGQLDTEFVDDSCLLSPEEWKRLEGVSKSVDKLHSVAELLFHAKYPTATTFLKNLYDLRVSLELDFPNSCSYVNTILEKLLQKFDRYWEDTFLVMAMAAVMDPRCKMVYIEYLCSKGGNDKSQHSAVLETVRSFYDDYLTSSLQKEISECDSCPSDYEIECFNSENEDDLPSKRRKVGVVKPEGKVSSNPTNIRSHLEDYQQFVQANSQPPRSELDWYLEEPVLPWDQDFNVFEWWKTERPKYPTLSKMARDLLAIPFSVLTSYDAYYTEERFIDKRLLSSRGALMNSLMCTRSWHQRH
ncbi:zinc finger BED domain-containing protein RICESLEEPER 1 [Coffea arabica]|uniref:Zinc finger BED domain-containing protein RICESLEEPER 1 n=2 Tax=Coffea TaxID=13442 RepID=A0A6P6WIJ7_COFAR|nr:zinc finger BED domain-containing protein RICESLEEPER 1-like [Coffea arabica]